tara:strand:+ start:221 stop:613 length:393 start_codon:yes stop_codon:yes gene_type:complete
MTNDNEPDSNIIKFPKKNPKIGIVVDNKAHEIRENIIFTENLCEALVVNMIHNMSENGMNVDNETFIRDTSFLIELVKSTIYRDLGMIHPLQDLVETLTTVTKDEGGVAYDVDIEGVANLIKEIDKPIDN